MSTSKIVIGAAGAAVLLLVTTTLHEWQARAASGETLEQAQSAHAALQMRFQSLGERVRRSEAEAATLRAQSTNAQAAVPRATSVVPGRSEAEEADAFLARHPELKRLAWQQRRAQVEGSYEPLFKLLRLTPEQVGRFVDLVSQGASGSFAGPNGEVIRYTLEGDRRQAEAELRLMLGEEGFKVYTTYFDTIGPAWQTAIQLAGDLYHSPTPLTAAQGEQVLRILIDGRVATDWSARPQFDWPAIMAQARGVLTPEQISALSDLSAHDRFGQAVTRARRRGELQ